MAAKQHAANETEQTGISEMKTLDRSRSYGTICGTPPIPSAMYDQDGLFFDSDGNLCDGQDRPTLESVGEKPIPKEQIKPEEATPIIPADKTADDGLDAVESKVAEMHAEGKSLVEISRTLGIHHMKVKSIIANL